MNEMIYCKKCLPPGIGNLTIDQDGICSACKTKAKFYALTEDHGKKERLDLIKLLKNKINIINLITTVLFRQWVRIVIIKHILSLRNST